MSEAHVVSCDNCGQLCTVGAWDIGSRIKCTACWQCFVAKSRRILSTTTVIQSKSRNNAQLKVPTPPPSPSPPSVSTVSPEPPEPLVFTLPSVVLNSKTIKTFLLLPSGIVLLLMGYLYGLHLNERDEAAKKLEDAVWESNIQLYNVFKTSVPAPKEVKPSNRAPCYLLYGLGGICIALGVVCIPGSSMFTTKEVPVPIDGILAVGLLAEFLVGGGLAVSSYSMGVTWAAVVLIIGTVVVMIYTAIKIYEIQQISTR